MTTWFVQTAVVALMTFLYLWWPIAQSNVLGVTAMALGTAVLLWPVQRSVASGAQRFNRVGAAVAWCGKNSYELYLFHLIPLAVLKTGFPRATVLGDEKLVLLAAFMLFSFMLAAGIARYYAEPLNRALRQRIVRPRSAPATTA